MNPAASVSRTEWHGVGNTIQGVVGALALGAGILFCAPAMALFGGVVVADYASDLFTGRGLSGWFAKLTGWGNPDAGSIGGTVADALSPRRPAGVSYRQPYTAPVR